MIFFLPVTLAHDSFAHTCTSSANYNLYSTPVGIGGMSLWVVRCTLG